MLQKEKNYIDQFGILPMTYWCCRWMDFKSYVLGIMFYRYISENLTTYVNKGEIESGNKSFDYSKMKDADAEQARKGLVEEKGFFILPSELFCNVRAKAQDDENLNETLERVFNHIEESAKGTSSESDFSGLFDNIDVNSNKLGATVEKRNKKLAQILDNIADMKLGNYQDNSIDAFGDAYEYLMDMYASNAGKSGGDAENINDDIVFEVELLKQVEINIDYILMLVQKYHDVHCNDKDILISIQKAVDSSPELRSKKALIENFIANVNEVDDVLVEWRHFIAEEKGKELVDIITSENLKETETRKFIEDSFKNGTVKTTGTDIEKILPPTSRFGGGNRDQKNQGVISKILAFFERFFGLGA